MRLVAPEHARLTQAHDDLALLIELVNLVSQPPSISGLRPLVPVGRPLRHPKVSLVVEEEAMGEPEESPTEAVHKVAVEV